ncbi:uncharacterized protein LOC114848379 [Betta splendens]|uniref:Uncharacterized protein LOC114848379 n=1 Tax=Betta splendens TaxID=158456 RepID=A0A6P7LLE1_BETSP|nr:uncharacterized protein LOC114848379 [Betta splendens]
MSRREERPAVSSHRFRSTDLDGRHVRPGGRMCACPPQQSSRAAVLPPLSGRTLHHPSFLPHYTTAHFGRQRRNGHNQEAHPIIPAEFFYSDPAMCRGTRIHNEVTGLRVLEFFKLNTPPPVMSAGLATPNRPDPFGCGPHPMRDLGSASWMLPHLRPVHPRHVIVQLSQEEDQVITNLLKLHHQSPLAGSESSSAAKLDFFSAAGPPLGFNSRPFLQAPEHHTLHHDVQPSAWSDSELEAANTLVSCFVSSQGDEICHQYEYGCAERGLGLLPDQLSSSGTNSPRGPEAPPASSPHSQSALASCCMGPKVDASRPDVASAEDGLTSGGLAEVRGQTLADSEGDAVHVLLSLGEVEPVGPMQ